MTLTGGYRRPERDASDIRYKKNRGRASAGSCLGEVVWLFSTLAFEESAPQAVDTWVRVEGPSTSKTFRSVRQSTSSDT